MNKYTMERFGGLIKEEALTCIENELLFPDTCVLESVSPFSGYYYDVSDQKPLYLYVMLEGSATFWHVLPVIEKVKQKAGFYFDAAFGEISFSDHTHCYTIRVRDLDNYNQIADLQKLLKEEGLLLRKKSRKIYQIPGTIRLEKFFYFDSWGENMFLDKQQDHHGYFEISKELTWDSLKKLSQEVKFETSLLYFDAALAYYFEEGEIKHLIRIYKENLTSEKLKAIKDRYYMLIDKFK
ncbi:MAG: hypothetical protein FD155_2427 [Bacteroidetes bacterium]|nr:MAG: hypothetical protein FD155_2427 [Bacteroidota bacterium]